MNRTVDEMAWPWLLHDLARLGATPGELLRIIEMRDCGLTEVSFSLVESVLNRLRQPR